MIKKIVLGYFILILGCQLKAQSRSLDDYIQAAQQNSPLIRGLQNQILQAQLDSLILKASFHTQVNFLSNDLYAPVIAGWGYDEAITNGAQVSGVVQASRNFVNSGNRAAQFRTLALQSQALRDTIRLTMRDLVKTITDQYITAYADQLTYNYTKQLFDLLKNEEGALKKLAQDAVIKQTEFLAFDITLQQQELNFLQSQIQYTGDYLTLNYLSGIIDTTIQPLAEPALKDTVQNDLYASVFFQRYTTDSLRIENERRLIDYSYRPVIGAFVDAGYSSSLQFQPYKNLGVSVGLNVKVPIYDGHQKTLKYRKLDIEERSRQANRNFFISQYSQQVATLNLQLHATEELFRKISHQIEYTRTLIESYAKLLQTSDVKVTDFVTAITNYLNAQNTYRQTVISRLRIINQLNYYNR